MDQQHSFETLVAAMAAIGNVICAFEKVHQPHNCSLEAQDHFSETVVRYWESPHGPSRRYLQELVRQYIQLVGEDAVESEALLELLLKALKAKKSDIPNPDEFCYLSFRIDETHNGVTADQHHDTPLRVRIFPHHNDVALRVWEAGAVLGEYLLSNPHLVRNQRVVELGAGVGLTGLVVSGSCQAQHVLCTDYTEKCLDNLQHNIETNRLWLQRGRGSSGIAENELSSVISQGYLEWAEYGDAVCETAVDCPKERRPHHTTMGTVDLMDQATVLIGADLAYDWNCMEPLARTIRRFLQSGAKCDKKKLALLATTIRNKDTFALLQEKLKSEGIQSNLEMSGKSCTELPLAFPIKFTQPRSDVTIYSLTIA